MMDFPKIEITDEDVARWGKYNDDKDPTHEAYVEFHVRERQLKSVLHFLSAIVTLCDNAKPGNERVVLDNIRDVAEAAMKGRK
jgi:hypothetical protein